MIAVDTNLLIYSHRAEAELHRTALAELTALAEGSTPWALPVFCVAEFLRVVTHPRVFNPPSPAAAALEFLEALTSSPTCRLVLPTEEHLVHLRETVLSGDAKGNMIFDAQIVALCQEHGIPTIMTNDRDFARFPNLDIRYLSSA